MAEKEISTLISRQQEIICLLKPLIIKQEEIKTLLDDKIKEIRMHHLGCNIARSIGTGATAAGAGLAVSSAIPVISGIGTGATAAGAGLSVSSVISSIFGISTGATAAGAGLSVSSAISSIFSIGTGATAAGAGLAVSSAIPIISGIGLVALLAGKLVSFTTDFADEVRSKNFIKNARDIVALQNNLAENLKEKLNDFQMFLETIQSNRSKEMLENTGLNLKERFGSQQSSMVKSHSDLCGSISTDIDFESLVNSFKDRCNEVEKFVNIVTMSETLLPMVAAALQAIGVLKEIEKVIQSWKKKHPSEEVIHEILERLLESIKSLKRLRKDIEENVVLLEEKLSVITAIVTYEKINDLINPLVSKQEKTVKWAVKEEAKLSIPHMITCNIIMIMIISMFTAIVAFELGLLGEVTCGSLRIIVTCLSIAVLAAFADDLLFKNFVKALEEQIAERECSVRNLREKLIETNRLPRLRQLLETDKNVHLEEAIGSTPDRPIIKAAKKIGAEIHGLTMRKSSSKRLSGMQGLLIEASVILEAICRLDNIGSAVGRWASKNNVQKRLVSQISNDLINYTKSIEKLLESYKEARKASE